MKKNESEAATPLGGLKEIREIIFGEAFRKLQKEIGEIREENKSLKTQLNLHENKISNSSKLIDELIVKQKNSEAEQKKTKDLIDILKSDLENRIKELNISKLDKNQIGQAFIEWGTKVTQKENM